jgi:PAS domain-containing protein
MPVKSLDMSEPKPTESVGQGKETGSIGAQRLMFVGYWEWDMKTGKYSWCEEMYRIFNLPPQTSLRTGTFFNGVHPEDRERVAKALGKALVGSEPYDMEHRIVWPDGSVRSVHGKVEVTYDGNRPTRVLGSIQDITDNQEITEP